MSELTGKRALVTGASSGIGAAIAHELAAHGVDLVLTGRRRDALDAVATACTARGVRADTITTDLGVPGAATTLWTAARTAAPIDILINNAGFGYFRAFAAVEWQRDAELIQLNITSLVELSRRFIDDRGDDRGDARGGRRLRFPQWPDGTRSRRKHDQWPPPRHDGGLYAGRQYL